MRSTLRQSQNVTNRRLQEFHQGEFPGEEGYNRDEEVVTIISNEDRWETAAEMETEEFHQMEEQQD